MIVTALTICCAVAFITVFLLMRRVQQFSLICEMWERKFAKISTISNACRLLSIHRNGRLNVFTFARGDETFTIETMGLLSDNIDEWRKVAGLSSDERQGLTQC